MLRRPRPKPAPPRPRVSSPRDLSASEELGQATRHHRCRWSHRLRRCPSRPPVRWRRSRESSPPIRGHGNGATDHERKPGAARQASAPSEARHGELSRARTSSKRHGLDLCPTGEVGEFGTKFVIRHHWAVSLVTFGLLPFEGASMSWASRSSPGSTGSSRCRGRSAVLQLSGTRTSRAGSDTRSPNAVRPRAQQAPGPASGRSPGAAALPNLLGLRTEQFPHQLAPARSGPVGPGPGTPIQLGLRSGRRRPTAERHAMASAVASPASWSSRRVRMAELLTQSAGSERRRSQQSRVGDRGTPLIAQQFEFGLFCFVRSRTASTPLRRHGDQIGSAPPKKMRQRLTASLWMDGACRHRKRSEPAQQ